MIGIIDYDAGNLRSVEKAFHYIGEDAVITRNRDELLSAEHVVLPGVGSFGDAMKRLADYELIPVIHEIVQKGTPFLGICLGLQLLFERSDESQGVDGLGILKGEILRIPAQSGLKIPHIGWNDLTVRQNAALFQNLPRNPYVYFVHSYYLKAADKDIVAATTCYSTQIDASVEAGNVFACQFHPEKSGRIGLQILRNFAALSAGRKEA